MSDSTCGHLRTQGGDRHDGVINYFLSLDPRWRGSRGRTRATSERCRALLSRAAQFSKTALTGHRVSLPRNSRVEPRKRPLSRGPVMSGRYAGRGGRLVRGGSFRDSQQERPRSIATARHEFQAGRPRSEPGGARSGASRPGCTRPSSSAAGTSRRSPGTRLAVQLHAPLREQAPRLAARDSEGPGEQRGQVHLSPVARRCDTSGMSSGAARSLWTRSKWASASSPAPSPWKRSTSRRARAPLGLDGRAVRAPRRRAAARSRCPSPRRGCSSAFRTSRRARR